MKNIHKIHMDISYQTEHPIHRYIEKESNDRGYGFNRKHTITMNKQNRFDQSISIIKGLGLPPLSDNFIKNLSKCIDIETIKNYDIESLIESEIQGLGLPGKNIYHYLKNYQQKINNGTQIQIIEWIFDLYKVLKNNLNQMKGYDVSCLFYFLGTIEWFHLLIIKSMFSSYHGNKFFIMGEILDFDPGNDLLNDTI
jgi:hypothetical protein